MLAEILIEFLIVVSGMNDFLKRRVDLNLKARKGERR
jgi:hypothetical protein